MKKLLPIALVVVMALSLAACGGEKTPPPEDTGTPGTATPGPETVTITVYKSDETAENFLTDEAEIQELTAENVLDALITAGVVNKDVKVASFDSSDPANLKLDLSAEVQTQASSLGTSGEYMLIGSVVNTFLTAFDAQGMTITADGKTLETGHAIYDTVLGMHTAVSSEG